MSELRLGSTTYRLGIAALVLAGAAIRFTNVDFGLPSFYHADEERKARLIELILAGEPHTYLNHPGMLINSVALLCAALRALGYGLDLPAIVLAGRNLVALVGTMTVLPTAGLARVLFGRGAGLFAGAAIAFSPLHTIHSRYMKEDVYLTFFIMLSLYALARWLRATPAWRETGSGQLWLALAFAAAGFALASKYVGGILVLLVLEVWRRTSAASWRQVIARAAAIALIPVFATPQLFTALSEGRRGLYTFFWEMQHGTIGGRDRLTLYVWEWPDLGGFFLFHGLGWGNTWPIAILGIAALVVAWRRRRTNDLALGMVAISAVLWYAVAEATPLKRGGDVERYILPCSVLFVVMAASWFGDGNSVFSSERVKAVAACMLLLVALAHSLLLTSAIDDDTRRMAALWLRDNGPPAPYEIVYFGDDAYRLDGGLLPDPHWIRMGYLPRPEDDAAIEGAEVVTFSELELGRYEKFPKHSQRQLAARERLRAAFPVLLQFRKPFYLKAGFHNPDIEVRLRQGQALP